MTDTAHLTALITRLANERVALARAKTDQERALRTVWVLQCEKEVNGEEEFLGLPVTDYSAPEISMDDLLAELAA